MTVYRCANNCGWTFDPDNFQADSFTPVTLEFIPADAVAPFSKIQLVTILLCPVCQYRKLIPLFKGDVPEAVAQ